MIITINTQWFKTKLVNYSTEFLSQELNYPLTIASAEISYFNSIKLHQLHLNDAFNNKMITIESTNITFDLWTILDRNIIIENVVFNGPCVHLIKNKKDGLMNLNEFIKAIQKRFKKDGAKPPKIEFKINSVNIRNGLMTFNDLRKDSIHSVFDYYHFSFNNINIDASGFLYKDKIASFHASNLNFIEPSFEKKVHQLNADVQIGLDFIELDKLDLTLGESNINNYLRFDFEDFKAFDDFNGLVTITAKLNDSKLTSDDIGIFSTTVRNNLNETWVVSGDYKGTVNRFKSDNFQIKFGHGSEAKGEISLEGLPDFYNTFLDIKLNNSHIKTSDLIQYFPSTTAQNNVQKFGHLIANGNFVGFPLDFVSFGDFETSLGHITTDINLKLSEGREKAFYKGKIATTNFKLGKLIEESKYINKIDLNGKIEGNGMTVESANFNLEADISRFDLLDYSYSNIKTKGYFSKRLFNGDLSIKDTNLNFEATGLLDLTRSEPVIKVKSNLKKSNLKALKFTDVESNVSTKLDINIKGNNVDNMVGAAKFDSLEVTYDSNYLNLSSITLFSSLLKDTRSFSAVSPYFFYKMDGDYSFSILQRDLFRLRKELLLGLENNEEKINNYYASKTKDTSNYSINFYLKLLDMNPLFKLYNIDMGVAKNTEVFGDFKQTSNTMLNLYSEIEQFNYGENDFEKINIEINSSKFRNSSDVLAFGLIESQDQKLFDFNTEDLHCEAVWAADHLELQSYIKQKDSDNHASLISSVNFDKDITKIALDELEVLIYDQSWKMVDSNLVTIQEDKFKFNNLEFGHELQKIALNGEISKDPTKKAQLKIENFNLDLLNPLLPQKIEGVTQFTLNLRDMFGNQKVNGNFYIDSLTIAENMLGEVNGNLNWNKNKEDAWITLNLLRKGNIIANVNGLIFPFKEENNLKLNATLNKQPVKIVEPYFKAYASQFRGEFDSKLKINGKFSYPIITGDIQLHDVIVKYDYLNVNYTTSDKISLSKDKISFDKFIISDKFDNHGSISGSITHTGFTNYSNNLNLKFNKLLTLNTTAEDNSLYFGKIFATGEAKITGPTNDVTLKANAVTNKNTEIYIPLNGYEGVEEKDFIRFIDFEQNNSVADTTTGIDLTGINMDFNFELTPDAYMEIIFDPKAGDIIRGTGAGDLNLVIDTRGEFNVYGDYTINEGAYNFTLLNIVNKEFIVTPGGIVSWNGDPYKGSLNIEAKYEQRASLSPIVIDTTIWVQNPSLKFKKYPTDVMLNLQGNLLSPEINLDIDIDDENLGVLQSSVNLFENEIKNNEQELNRQVFSLIILKQFAQLNSFENFNIGASAGRSMSELVSNQLSYWMSQVDENLEIDLDLGTLSAADNSSYQLRLTYSLLDGRLRLSNQTDYDKSSDLSSVTGEWTVEYLVTRDGRVKLKMYNRTSQNSYSNDIDNSTYTTAGASVVYTKGFNNLKELFSKKDKKEKK